MNIDWLKAAGEACRVARYDVSLRPRVTGVEVRATAPGGFHSESRIVSWDELEHTDRVPRNPIVVAVDALNQRLGRKIAQRIDLGRPESV